MSLFECKIIELPKICDPRGNLTFIEGCSQIPFEIKRVYFLYDVPVGADRGGHAHRELEQFVVAMSGSFSITLDDGKVEKFFNLNRSYYGLYISPGNWRVLDNFSSGAVCLVLASDIYKESDYIRNYNDFVLYKNS